jgi:agmatine/peptidylarginine deiminase
MTDSIYSLCSTMGYPIYEEDYKQKVTEVQGQFDSLLKAISDRYPMVQIIRSSVDKENNDILKDYIKLVDSQNEKTENKS